MPSLLQRDTMGALVPPPGVVPNFKNPENMSKLIVTLVAVSASIITVFVAVRTYTRFVVIKRRGWEDYILLLAWLVSTVYMVTIPTVIKYGAGVHQWDVTVENAMVFAERANLCDMLYSVVVCLVKVAILVQLLHIFAPNRICKMWWAIWAVIGIQVVFYIIVIIVRALLCLPREKIWNPSVPGHCLNGNTVMVSTASFNIVSDFAIFCLPISRVWQLKISRAQKWGISAVFATGLFGCAASIMRLVVTMKIIRTGDVTYELLNAGFWSFGEVSSGILCCCLPVFPQFYRRYISQYVSQLVTSLVSSNSRSTTTVVERSGESDDSRGLRAKEHWDWKSPGANTMALESLDRISDEDTTGGGTPKRVESGDLGATLPRTHGWEDDLEFGRIRKTIEIELKGG